MSNFLTLEDINTCLYNNQGFWLHKIDMSKITTGTEEFTNVKYDFCTISRQSSGTNWIYLISVDNPLFTNNLVIYQKNGHTYNPSSIDEVSPNVFMFYVPKTYEPIVIFLYMGCIRSDNIGFIYYKIRQPILELTLKYLNDTQYIQIESIDSSDWDIVSQTVELGYNRIEKNGLFAGYLLVKLMKTKFQFNCNQTLTVGKVNKVQLGTSNNYKPNGSEIGNNTPIITVKYKNQNIPVVWDNNLNDYVFNLDLTDKTVEGLIKFKVLVEGNEVLNSSETNVILRTEYDSVSTFNILKNLCIDDKTRIIKLGSDMDATSNLNINHNIKILGNDKTLNMNEYSVIVSKNVKLICNDTNFENGDNCFVQKLNSELELDNCKFINCVSSGGNGLGSCIMCDIDIDSLNIDNDFDTKLYNCLFENNGSVILHGGSLIVDNCSLHNTSTINVNTKNAGFLYQVDGSASITNSIFDIDYDTSTFCNNNVNLGFAQSLIMCGETATINGANHESLQNDKSLPFFNEPYNNQSHIFAKYYYSNIGDCVYISPLVNFENKSVCHSVSGVDWVFKNNCKLSRISSGNENSFRLLEW